MPFIAGHTHAVIDQRFSRISVLLRKLDAYTPPDLCTLLQGLFRESEEDGSEYILLPGWDGLEDVDSAASGPGDFKAVFDASAITSTQRLTGYGTSRDDGRRCELQDVTQVPTTAAAVPRAGCMFSFDYIPTQSVLANQCFRIHSFKIHRDQDGCPVICSREHDFFGEYSAGLRIFKGSGLHPGVQHISGVQLQPNDDHAAVMQKVHKLQEILQRFGTGEEATGNQMQASKVLDLRKTSRDTQAYWEAYDKLMQQLQQAPWNCRFEFRPLPTNHLSDLDDDIQVWLDAFEDPVTAAALLSQYTVAAPEDPLPKGTVEAAAQALHQAVKTHDDTFLVRQEFTHHPSKELHLQGAHQTQQDDTPFDVSTLAVGDVVLVRINPEDEGQDGRPFAIGVALHPDTKTHDHKKGQVPVVYSDPAFEVRDRVHSS